MNAESEHIDDQPLLVGSYRLTKTLGKGTFGKVKLAEHLPTGQKVAVKVLQKELICQQADVQRISRQIKILKLIQHEFVIQLYEIIEQPQELFLIMQYADGGDLFQQIVDRERIPEGDAATYYYEVLQGVKYLHSLGITHRDLKPQNILLDSKKIKLADFGLGNFFKDGELLKTACGSPCYAAPQMVSKQKYNPTKVDVWSSGIILFAMNCGFLPFEDKNVSVLYNKIKKGEFRMPSHLSDSLKDLLKNVLNINPEERFSVDQILAHPWVVANARRYQALPYRSLSSDDGLLERVSNLYGFEKERLKRSLETNKHNAMTTAFYLYVKKEKIRSNNREIALTKPEHQTTAVETLQPTPNVKQEPLPSKTDEENLFKEPIVNPNNQQIKIQENGDSHDANNDSSPSNERKLEERPVQVNDSLKLSDEATFVTQDLSLKGSIELPGNSDNSSIEANLHHSAQLPATSIGGGESHQHSSTEQHKILIEDESKTKPSHPVKNIPTLTFPKTTKDSEKTEPRETPKASRYPAMGIHKNQKPKEEEPPHPNRPQKALNELFKPKSEKKFEISARQPIQTKVVHPPSDQLHNSIEIKAGKAPSVNTSVAEGMPGKLKKNPRMKIENMRKTATKLYERSTSRSTQSIKLVPKKPQRKFTWKRISKKPRLINAALLFVGSIQSLKKHLMNLEDRQEITVELYEMREDVLYILRSNIEPERLAHHLRTLLHS